MSLFEQVFFPPVGIKGCGLANDGYIYDISFIPHSPEKLGRSSLIFEAKCDMFNGLLQVAKTW